MKLPDFAAQSLYLDFGWALVLTAAVLALLPRSAGWAASRRRWTLWVGGVLTAAMLLPAPWSPSFWLGMAFQYPSVMLVALCAVFIGRFVNAGASRAEAPLVPALPAAMLSVLALALYAGAFAWTPFDLYAVGYAQFPAAVIASTLVVIWARFDAQSGWVCCAVATAAMVHAATRLPAGNAWDALLDPFLVVWMSIIVVRGALERLRHRSMATTQSLGQRA